jgi:hypothetical protein
MANLPKSILAKDTPALLSSVARERRARLLNRVCVVLALLWVALVGLTLAPEPDDFQTYWRGAWSVAQYGDPYALIHGRQQPNMYIYPPLFAYLMLPLGAVSLRAGQIIWFGVNVVMLAGLIAMCIRASHSVLARRYWGVLALLVAVAPPTRLSLQLGQVSILMALVMLGSFLLAKRRAHLSGLLLASSCLIKVFPATLALYFVLRRRVALLWAGVAGIAIVGVSLLVHGLAPYSNYLAKVVLGRDYPYFGEHNVSLFGFWGRLFTPNDYGVALADAPLLARALVIGCGLLVLAICAWASLGRENALAEPLRFGAWLGAMMLVSPSNGTYTFVVLLLPLLAVLRVFERTGDRRVLLWLCACAGLLCWPPAWTDWQPWLYNHLHTGWGLLFLTPAFYGLLLTTGLCGWLAHTVAASNLGETEEPRRHEDTKD